MSACKRNGQHVVVIGGGIVGICCTLSLLRDGHRVTVIERQGLGEGASYGNGSVIATDAVVPVQTPGILRKVPGMLLDPLGPLAIRWRYLPRITPWLVRFIAASTTRRVEDVSVALANLLRGAVDAYRPLLELAGEASMIRRTGWLCVYETEAEFRTSRPMLELRRRRGVNLQLLEPEELRQLEPNLAPIFARGVLYPDVAYAVNNFRLVKVLAEAAERLGGRILRSEARGFELGSGGVRSILTTGEPLGCDAVVVAAGAWSKPLAARLGSRVPLDTERGYHVHLSDPGVSPRLPVYSAERGFVCTPLEHGLRVAGTVELGGLAAPPDWRRADVLLHHARRWLPGLRDARVNRWMGFRPSFPDSVPVIGQSPHHPNAFFAFGHGHIGLTLGARTGQLVADLVAGRDPGIAMQAYRADRF